MTDKENIYRFIRTLNNNAVLAHNEASNTDVILTGKGIGFRPKEDKNDFISSSQIEKTFISLEYQWKAAYLELIDTVDEKLLALVSEIVLKAAEDLGELHPSLVVVLTGHINFAFERLRAGIIIQNPLLYEIKLLYPQEFSVALAAKELLEDRFDITIGDEEAGYIALHFNAARQKRDVKTSMKRPNLLALLVEKVQDDLKVKLDADSMERRQLAYHLKGVIERIEAEIKTDNPLIKTIKKIMPDEYDLAEKLSLLLEGHFGKKIDESEIAHIASHIYRIKSMLKNQKQ